MRHRIAYLLLTISMCLAPSQLTAQNSAEGHSLMTLQRRVRLIIVQGRIQASAFSFMRGFSATLTQPDGKESETLQVTVTPQIQQIRYQRVAKQTRLTMVLNARGEMWVTIDFDDPEREPIRFQQPAQGPITLAVGSVDYEEHCNAIGIWQLFLTHPQLCQQHLIPALESLQTNWRLSDTCASIEEILLELAINNTSPETTDITRLIEQLAHHQFSVRRRAEKELLGFGSAVLGPLRQIDNQQLDAEQKRRIQRVVNTLSFSTEDTPARVAGWLVNDLDVWESLLDHLDGKDREIAFRQRSSLMRETAKLASPSH